MKTPPPLLSDIYETNTIFQAHKRALRGKRRNRPATKYNYILPKMTKGLQAELATMTYTPRPYRKKHIYEPKPRIIEAPHYRDRVVQHAIHSHLSPFYERFFIPASYACRPGKGTHNAANHVQRFLRQDQNLYVCQLDISKYYASINHTILEKILNKKIKDPQLMWLLRTIIRSSNSGTEHDHLFSPDNHFLTRRDRGIPIGNLTSQLFANIYLHEVDMYAKQKLKIRHYIRYMDDILFFHESKTQLHEWRQLMESFLYTQLHLTVNPRKVRIYPAHHGVSFVGFVIHPFFKTVRSSSIRRFRKRYRKQLRQLFLNKITPEQIVMKTRSWKAHVSHANTENLKRNVDAELEHTLFARAVRNIYRQSRK